jgi:hypothetical protein
MNIANFTLDQHDELNRMYGSNRLAHSGPTKNVFTTTGRRRSRTAQPLSKIERLLALPRAERLSLLCQPVGQLTAAETEAIIGSLS